MGGTTDAQTYVREIYSCDTVRTWHQLAMRLLTSMDFPKHFSRCLQMGRIKTKKTNLFVSKKSIQETEEAPWYPIASNHSLVRPSSTGVAFSNNCNPFNLFGTSRSSTRHSRRGCHGPWQKLQLSHGNKSQCQNDDQGYLLPRFGPWWHIQSGQRGKGRHGHSRTSLFTFHVGGAVPSWNSCVCFNKRCCSFNMMDVVIEFLWERRHCSIGGFYRKSLDDKNVCSVVVYRKIEICFSLGRYKNVLLRCFFSFSLAWFAFFAVAELWDKEGQEGEKGNMQCFDQSVGGCNDESDLLQAFGRAVLRRVKQLVSFPCARRSNQ